MLNYDFSKMLFKISADRHSVDRIRKTLLNHPEIKFVSLVGIDIGGHDTDGSRLICDGPGDSLPDRTCAMHQRAVTTAIKRARIVALLPYTQD